MPAQYYNVGDGVASGSTGGPITWSHTIPDGPDDVYVYVFGLARTDDGGGQGFTAASVGGQACTQLGAAYRDGYWQPCVFLYYIKNPPSGAQTVSMSLSATQYASGNSVCVVGVNKTTPHRALGTAENGNPWTADPSDVGNDLILGFLGGYNPIGAISGGTEVNSVVNTNGFDTEQVIGVFPIATHPAWAYGGAGWAEGFALAIVEGVWSTWIPRAIYASGIKYTKDDLAGTLTMAGGLVRKTKKSLTGAISTITGVVVLLLSRGVRLSATVRDAMLSAKARDVTLSAIVRKVTMNTSKNARRKD